MSEPALLTVEKLEVVYHRAITAVRGISLSVRKGQIVAILGTNGAGKSTTLRAISGFLGIDDARVTDGSITFNGKRIENRQPNEITRLGIALVPEREKVFPNLTVVENLTAPFSPVAVQSSRQRKYRVPVLSALGGTAHQNRGAAVGRRTADAGARQRAGLSTGTPAGRRIVARPRARRGGGSDRAAGADPP